MEKAFKTYKGGKEANGTPQNIINLIPKHDRFIEVMAGNATIARYIRRASVTVVNDIDAGVIDKNVCAFRNLYPSVIDGIICTDQGERIIFENMNYPCLIDKYDVDGSDSFFYFDPPYHFDTRSHKEKIYKFDWVHSDHLRFLDAANTVKSNCMISHYPFPLYDEALKGWHTFDFQSKTRVGLRTERLYMNYPTPDILHDTRYLGSDYIDRQRIKRKIHSFISKLEKMPTNERMGILTAVIDKYGVASAALLK